MEERLEELRREFARGQERWDALEEERRELRDTMLRISGAIQVLEELRTRNGDDAIERPARPAVVA